MDWTLQMPIAEEIGQQSLHTNIISMKMLQQL